MSAPVTWQELEGGARLEDFDIFNVPARVARLGDLWCDLLKPDGRVDLNRFL